MEDSYLKFLLQLSGIQVGPSQVYYIKVEISNFGPNEVTVRWKFDGRDQQQISRGGSVAEIGFAIVSSVTPEPVRFTGVLTSNTGQNVLLNGAQFVEVKPTTSRDVTKIQIGKLFFFFYHIYIFNKLSILTNLYLSILNKVCVWYM